jgi:hypothetical protein
MSRFRSGLALALLLLFLPVRAFCSSSELANPLREWLLKAPVRKTSFWKLDPMEPLDARIVTEAPGELLHFIQVDNANAGIPQIPSAARNVAAFVAELRSAIRELPMPILSRARKRLAAIVLVQGLGTTGYTVALRDAAGASDQAIVVLDVSLIRQSANTWATWKENTPFRPSPGYELRVTLESTPEDTRKNAIQFVLLHELGHVLAIQSGIVEDALSASLGISQPSGFNQLSWRSISPWQSRWDDILQARQLLRFYAPDDAKRPIELARAIYSELLKTDFPTLYSATSPFDDFAESIATYAHCVLMHKPYQVVLRKSGKELARLECCWSSKDPRQSDRCTRKKELLERFLGSP